MSNDWPINWFVYRLGDKKSDVPPSRLSTRGRDDAVWRLGLLILATREAQRNEC